VFYSSEFKPAWWLTSPHGQSMLAKLLRKKLVLNTMNETIELPDGDFVDLAWTQKPDEHHNKPIVVILHGLEGSVNSHYAKGMMTAVKKNNWIGVVIHFRGCSGRPNRQAKSYHSADTRDLTYLTPLLVQQYPNAPLFLIGFSLGGNVAVNYLADVPNNPYQAAVIICAPLDLASCSKKVNEGISKIYQKYLLDMLKNSALIKYENQQITTLSPEKINKISTLWQFDEEITAPLNNFKDAADYYHQASGKHKLNNIEQPCLVIHAADDPFMCHQDIIKLNITSPNIHFEISQYGGHVGFITGNNPFSPHYWLESKVPNFISRFL
jgi:predicted alpha/beta-fold hydrolase